VGDTQEVVMAGQERVNTRRDDEEPADDAAAPAPATPSAQARDAEVDALLDEIDDVLESNAEQFVRGFVQKGGQ
jgi:ubiquitin-like protein Pup